jgi:hypothetical protein
MVVRCENNLLTFFYREVVVLLRKLCMLREVT